jgi:hypothetical protein
VGKLKIVEAEARRAKVNTTTAYPAKENDWGTHLSLTYNARTDQIPKRPMSMGRTQQERKLETTQNRYQEVQEAAKYTFKASKKASGFDLDNYLMSMAQYTRSRNENI